MASDLEKLLNAVEDKTQGPYRPGNRVACPKCGKRPNGKKEGNYIIWTCPDCKISWNVVFVKQAPTLGGRLRLPAVEIPEPRVDNIATYDPVYCSEQLSDVYKEQE